MALILLGPGPRGSLDHLGCVSSELECLLGPIELCFYWPEAVLGDFYWPAVKS